MIYIAHKKDDQTQLLKDHLLNTATLASQFAKVFNADGYAYLAGIFHDIGKYLLAFYEHITKETSMRVDHSTAGAIELAAYRLKELSFVTAGHHTGLPNGGTRFDGAEMSSLQGRLKRNVGDYSAYHQELDTYIQSKLTTLQRPSLTTIPEIMFWIKMIYSCLVDADFLDTEIFMNGTNPYRTVSNLDSIHAKVMQKIKSLQTLSIPGSLNEVRTDYLNQAIKKADSDRGLYSLTIGTGGGKTLTSLAFAIEHAKRNKMDRIIYVIPYNSIIEQTAKVFADTVGEENVLAHYSDVDYKLSEDDFLNDIQKQKKYASENWDARIIVTSSVQFFESLYSSKPSKCRKLHNIANSVIIFDEAQALPLDMIKPCVFAMTELVKHYHSTAVLCTATQPALDSIIQEYGKAMKITDIVTHNEEFLSRMRRNHIRYEGKYSLEAVSSMLQTYSSYLCIVNTKKTALKLAEMSTDQTNTYCLTTLLTPNDRQKQLDEIRMRLDHGIPCKVIATSLIEAGVDVDFPVVFREIAGLDSIVQAAGRGNREGKRNADECIIHVMEITDVFYPDNFEKKISVTRSLIRKRMDLNSAETVSEYFRQLMLLKSDQHLDKNGIMEMMEDKTLPFADISAAFHMIEDNTINLYIPTDDNLNLVQELQDGKVSKIWYRRMHKDAVQITESTLHKLLQNDKIENLNGEYILKESSLYNAFGLNIYD